MRSVGGGGWGRTDSSQHGGAHAENMRKITGPAPSEGQARVCVRGLTRPAVFMCSHLSDLRDLSLPAELRGFCVRSEYSESTQGWIDASAPSDLFQKRWD